MQLKSSVRRDREENQLIRNLERSSRMFRNHSFTSGQLPTSLWLKRIIFGFVMMACLQMTGIAQETQRAQPVWWFGVAGGANFNWYHGEIQILNASITAPTAFHEGFGAGYYATALWEYRPDPVWGVMLYAGLETRSGSFEDVVNPNNRSASLSTRIGYLTLEPSLRIAPFSSGFYVFVGPRIGINTKKAFDYTITGNPGYEAKLDWSEMRSVVFTAQVGAGFDIPLRPANHATQMNLSPFVSFQPNLEQDPRNIETWNINTVRVGLALKFGGGDIIPGPAAARTAAVEGDVEFSIRAPKAVPVQRKVRETFPIRNYVFFNEGSTDVPARYVALTKDQAKDFREEQLQTLDQISITGRSHRQLALYYNILNILGDRLRRNSGTTVSLTGASEKGTVEGKAFAESIKGYLTTIFGIEGSRIATEGFDKPRVPSEQPGGTRELTLLRAEDRRVDIESKSPELLMQVGGPYDALKPAQIVVTQEDPLDSHVMFHVDGARGVLASWSLEITDDAGVVQRFGPFTRENENIPGNRIIGTHTQADYKVVMVGQTKMGRPVRKQGSLHLVRREEPKVQEALRFSILFEFNTSKTVATYSAFLTEMVTPLIPDGGTVIIHGHTDVIGDDEYNMTLSNQRTAEARSILELAVSKAGKSNVTFESYGFGEDISYSPFDNNLPEERCYNRTVIIDIVPR
jgi:outer membrane protein OmpA-like peptidoglycan-associated protein